MRVTFGSIYAASPVSRVLSRSCLQVVSQPVAFLLACFVLDMADCQTCLRPTPMLKCSHCACPCHENLCGQCFQPFKPQAPIRVESPAPIRLKSIWELFPPGKEHLDGGALSELDGEFSFQNPETWSLEQKGLALDLIITYSNPNHLGLSHAFSSRKHPMYAKEKVMRAIHSRLTRKLLAGAVRVCLNVHSFVDCSIVRTG